MFLNIIAKLYLECQILMSVAEEEYSCMSDFKGRRKLCASVSIDVLYSPSHLFIFLYGPKIRNYVDMAILMCLGDNYKLISPLNKLFL